MQATWVVLATAVAMVLAVPLSVPSFRESIARSQELTRNSLLEQILLGVIEEELRDIIINGNDDIPPLDPLYIEHVSLDEEDIPFPGAEVDLTGITMSNLATFVVDDLSVTMTSLLLQRYRVEVDGKTPEIDITIDHYDLNLSAMGFDLFGAGDAKIKLINPALKINVLVSVRLSLSGIYLNLLDTRVEFRLEAIEPEITGFYHDEAASAFINEFLKDFVPAFVDAYEPEITALISGIVHDIASEILEDLDISSLLG